MDASMIGKTILHYKILSKLGEGGMGVVYRAEDTKIKREVAIKFLPRQIEASDEERERFKIEAQAAGSLNHSNIATIYAIEESDHETFIVMEYIKGQELKDKIDAGPLPIDDTLNIAIQIAQGLQAAHEEGVVHRDIKSTNIMLTDRGEVKIMDFGLAKRGGQNNLTKEGTTLGTVAYMSPEQTRGDMVDHRSDLFSLGVLLYEILTAQLPFRGDYDQAVIYSILNEEPAPLAGLRTGTPAELERIVNKCLKKDASNRFQDANDLIADLQRLKNDPVKQTRSQATVSEGTATRKHLKRYMPVAVVGILIIAIVSYLSMDRNATNADAAKIMLAVLPFENLGLAEDEYFADGITGEITGRLSGISGLKVIARSSAMHYKNTTKSLPQIGEELNIDYVLEGTLQWAQSADGSKRVRLNPELIKISDATQVWSQPYEADFSNSFSLQTDIATKIAQALDIKLLKSEQQSLLGGITNNPEAYDTYLRAIEYSLILSDEKKLRIAEQMFLKAIAIDSSFAAAYARLSTVQSDMYWGHYERSDEILGQSKANAEKALRLDPNLALAHIAMGHYHYHGKLAYEQALQEYREAIRLQPNNAKAYLGVGYVLRRQGKMLEALEIFKRAYDLDPLTIQPVFDGLGTTYVVLRQYDLAIQMIDIGISVAPEAPLPYYFKALAFLLKEGETAEARSVIETARIAKIGIGDPFIRHAIITCSVLDGNLEEALKELVGSGGIDHQFLFEPEDLLVAKIHDLMDNDSMAYKKYDSAKDTLEKEIENMPDDSRLHSALGLSYAGLGRKSDAIRAGKRGIALLPVTKEAWGGSYRLLDLAQIYAKVGELDMAVDILADLLARPTTAVSVAFLERDPTWIPLREHPRFLQLIQRYLIETE